MAFVRDALPYEQAARTAPPSFGIIPPTRDRRHDYETGAAYAKFFCHKVTHGEFLLGIKIAKLESKL